MSFSTSEAPKTIKLTLVTESQGLGLEGQPLHQTLPQAVQPPGALGLPTQAFDQPLRQLSLSQPALHLDILTWRREWIRVIYLYLSVCVYIYIYVCMYVYIIYLYIYICIYIYIHTYVDLCWSINGLISSKLWFSIKSPSISMKHLCLRPFVFAKPWSFNHSHHWQQPHLWRGRPSPRPTQQLLPSRLPRWRRGVDSDPLPWAVQTDRKIDSYYKGIIHHDPNRSIYRSK